MKLLAILAVFVLAHTAGGLLRSANLLQPKTALKPSTSVNLGLDRKVERNSTYPGGHSDFFKILEDAYPGHFWKQRKGAAGLSSENASMWEEDKKNGDRNAATYGEIHPESTKAILERVGAKPGERYYDLGAGDGKTVMVAWLMGLNASGIELVPNRFQASCAALERLRNERFVGSKRLEFFQGSILKLDFSDADILFVQNLCFDWELTKGVAHAAKAMRKGARILSYSALPGLDDFRTIGTFEIYATYQDTSAVWSLQEKVSEPNAADANPEKLATVPSDRHCKL